MCAEHGGAKLDNHELPRAETAVRTGIKELQTQSQLLVVVDQTTTIGALPIAIARDYGGTLAYLPGLVLRMAADLYPEQAKTGARNAFIIADAASTMIYTLRAIDRDSDLLSALKF